MPFVQRVIEPKFLSRTSLCDDEGRPRVSDGELEAVTNNTLCNALRQLASLVLVADDIFADLGDQLQAIGRRSASLRAKVQLVEEKVSAYDPKTVTVPESDICTFALLKTHYASKFTPDTGLFTAATRPKALQVLYESATKTPVHLMRQMDRWRRDGHRSSRFFLCTPVLGSRRRRIRSKVDIDIETRLPDAVKDLRRWTSSEALGDITVTPDCPNRIAPNVTALTDGDLTDGTIASDDEAIDHKLPSPEEQVQVVALKFPAEIVAVDISGRSFDRMSVQRRSLLHGDIAASKADEPSSVRRRSRKPRSRRRNTLAGTDQKEIRDALTAGEEPSSSAKTEPESATVSRSKSSDLLRSSKKESPGDKKSHFNTLKQWGKTRYDRLMHKAEPKKEDIDDFNIYETVTMKRKRNVDKDRARSYERHPSVSSSDKSSLNLPASVLNLAVKLRESSAQRRQRRSGGGKDEPPHSSSGNWSASSESGRASIGSEFAPPKSTTSATTSSNSLNQPGSVSSRRRFAPTSAPGSVTSEGTLTPDIIHDLDGETSSVYSCDTEGYYTSFHMDSGLKTLKEEEMPCTPLHSSSAFHALSAENEYELFGKGSTSTTTSSAGTVCTTLRASDSSRSLNGACPAVPERKSSLSKHQEEDSDKTGTVKRSPATKALVHQTCGDVSPDSGHNTSSSPIESISSPNGVRSGSEFEFSESSDMEGPERTERIRIKTTINSSRIPSMCVITPPHSDDESVKSYNSLNNFNRYHLEDKGSMNADRNKLELHLGETGIVQELKSSDSDKENFNFNSRIISTNVNGTNKMQLINVNPQSGYATVENIEQTSVDINKNPKVMRAASPSGGSVTINKEYTTPEKPSQPQQPIIKATLLPLNNMLGRLKTNLANLAHRKDKSPGRPALEEDIGDYVTLADARNNNEQPPIYANAAPKKPAEYVSLDELPDATATDSLERTRRQGARVTLDAEGKVVYSSDSLRRRKAHSTFEPGPFVKSKLVIRAGSPAQRAAPKGAYVHIQEAAPDPDRVPSPSSYPLNPRIESLPQDMYNYRGLALDDNVDRRYPENQYYFQKGNATYQTLPSKRSQFFQVDTNPERSVTPDITRGLERSTNTIQTSSLKPFRSNTHLYQKLGIPVRLPDVSGPPQPQVPSFAPLNPLPERASYFQHISPHKSSEGDVESIKVSPIDPRSSGGFKSSTPSSKTQDLKAAVSLDYKLLSPKRSTMSNEELYAVIHKSKKKMNIETEDNRASPVIVEEPKPLGMKSPETGYINKSRSRLSWSPTKGEYIDFNSDIDQLSPPKDSRSRQSWACNDRKGTGATSTLDFKKLLLKKSHNILSTTPTKKLSAVEQLKLSKEQPPPPPKALNSSMNILELSGSPRSLVNRKFGNNGGSPRGTPEKVKAPPKIMSPRSQWRFANPRTDVLSSTILEDCREDESPNNSMEKKRAMMGAPRASTNEARKAVGEYKPVMSAAQRLQAQRAKFFTSGSPPARTSLSSQFESQNTDKCSVPPTLETAF